MTKPHIYRVKGEWFCKDTYLYFPGYIATRLGVASKSPAEAYARFHENYYPGNPYPKKDLV